MLSSLQRQVVFTSQTVSVVLLLAWLGNIFTCNSVFFYIIIFVLHMRSN